MERGKKKLGNKTNADTLKLIIQKLEESENYSKVFKNSSKKAIEKFKGKKILIGRARMFNEKTRDLDDPGMFAINKLCEVF